jgi:hypothetical protein
MKSLKKNKIKISCYNKMSIYPIPTFFDNIVRPVVTKTVVATSQVNSTGTTAVPGVYGAGSIITNVSVWQTNGTAYGGTYAIAATNSAGTGNFLYISLGTASNVPGSAADVGLGRPLPADSWLTVQSGTGNTGTVNMAVTYLAEARASQN